MARYRRRSRGRRVFDYSFTVIFFVGLAALSAWIEHQTAERISSDAVRVVDGDSLVMNGERIRLVGIDAPELDQLCRKSGNEYSCGSDARTHLRSLIGSSPVSCVGEGRDKYERLLAECFAGSQSLNAQMVKDGWAVAYGGFGWNEHTARKNGVGLWAGEFVSPADWRAESGGLGENKSGTLLRGMWRRARMWFQ